MFDMLRFTKEVSRNPWILVPVFGMIEVGFILNATLFAPSVNPLPVKNVVREARLARGRLGPRSDYTDVHGMDYIRLRICLDDSKQLAKSAAGAPLATLLVETLDGTETEVAFCADGIIQMGGEAYRVANGKRLVRIINELVPKPRPPHAGHYGAAAPVNQKALQSP